MKTADLIAKAEATGEPLARISRRLGLDPNALATAKMRRRLSPAVAAALAQDLGEPIARWTLQAVSEAERSAALRRKIVAMVNRGIAYFRPRRASRTVSAGRPTAAPTSAQVRPRARSLAASA